MKKGFTLIELLVVFSLMGIIMSIAIPAFGASRKSARDGKRKADLEMIRSALEMYRSDIGSYPLSGSLSTPLTGYLSSIPKDPLTSTDYPYSRLTTNTYILCANLETGGQAISCPGSCTCGTGSCNYEICNP